VSGLLILKIRVLFCKIIGAPVFSKLPEPIGPLNKDESVKFECIVDAFPKPTVTW
jgi:hypothetical protein